jgi:hypothetical protein
LGFAVFVLVCAGITVRYALAHSPGSSNTFSDQWLLAAFLLVCTAYGIMYARTRVVVSPGSPTFVVKNAFRTYPIAWSDVEQFTVRGVRIGGGPAGRAFVVLARLKNGHQIRCTGVGGVGLNPIDLCNQLEMLRLSAQGTGAVPAERS